MTQPVISSLHIYGGTLSVTIIFFKLVQAPVKGIVRIINHIKHVIITEWSRLKVSPRFWNFKRENHVKPKDTCNKLRVRELYKHGPACIDPSFTALLVLFLPINGCHFKKLLLKAKVLNTLIYCYYLLVRRSSMHLLSKFKLKIPPSYPNTNF